MKTLATPCFLIAKWSLALCAVSLLICCWSCSRDLPTRLSSERWPVKGTVEDRLGMPIAGADLKFYNNQDSATAISDVSGRFELQFVEGRYYFIAYKAGHLKYRDTVEVVSPGLELRIQLLVDPASIRWPVKGAVEDDFGLPITGADLKFHNDTDSAKVASDSLGRFEAKLLEGRYNLAVSKAGYLDYRDTIAVAPPGLEWRVRLVFDPAQDYLPLAVGNWWLYDDTASSFSSGIFRQSWGTQRWEIISISANNDKIAHAVRLEANGITITKSGIGGPPLDTTDYAETRQFEIVESNGRVVVDQSRGTVLKHFMQPGETFSTFVHACGISRVSAGIPMLVDNRLVETIAVDYAQAGCAAVPGSEKLALAQRIGIVLWEINLGIGNTRWFERLRLRGYFVH